MYCILKLNGCSFLEHPCEIDNGECEHVCNKLPDGFGCTCNEGFEIAGDEKSCNKSKMLYNFNNLAYV